MEYMFIFQIILLLAASALCVYLIIYFNRITKSIGSIEKGINALAEEIKPLIESTTQLSNNLNEISESAKEQVNSTKNIVSEVKERVDLLLRFEEKVREGVEGPVYGLIKNLSGLKNGVEVFLKTLRK